MTDTPFNMDTSSSNWWLVSPRPITTEDEYDRLLAIAERYTSTKELRPEERAVYKVVVLLIVLYQAENYPMDVPAPYLMLQHMVESKGIRQKDLVPLLGSNALVSRIVRGKSNISIRVIG